MMAVTGPFVVLLCGVPGSGKSAAARHFVLELETSLGCLTRHVAFDALEVCQEEWNETSFKASRVAALRTLEVELQAACCSPTRSAIVVDDIMYLRSMRRQVYVLGRKFSTPIVVVWVKASLPVALARNASREARHVVNEDTIRKLHEQFEPPSRYHTADRVSFVLENDHEREELLGKAVREVIADQLASLVEQRRAELQRLADSLLLVTDESSQGQDQSQGPGQAMHVLDLALRRLTSRVMTNSQASERRCLAELLTASKAAALTAARADPWVPPSFSSTSEQQCFDKERDAWASDRLDYFVDSVLDTAQSARVDCEALSLLLHAQH